MPTTVDTAQEKTQGTTGKSAVVWSSIRAGLMLVIAIVLGVIGNNILPKGEPQLPLREPTVSVLTNDSKFAGSMDMSLFPSGQKNQLYNLKLTITPAAGVPQGTKVRVTFGNVPTPIPSLKTGSFSSPQGGKQYYEVVLPTATATSTQTYSATYTSAQQIGEDASGGRLRVAFPAFSGEIPGLQYSVPACEPQGAFASPQYAALCASLGSDPAQWSVPVLQAGQSTLTSSDPGLAGYQYLAGDSPTLLNGSGWTWTGITGATVLAVSLAAEDAEQNDVFRAGILLGIAGGAAIAFIAEVFRPVWRKDSA